MVCFFYCVSESCRLSFAVMSARQVEICAILLITAVAAVFVWGACGVLSLMGIL